MTTFSRMKKLAGIKEAFQDDVDFDLDLSSPSTQLWVYGVFDMGGHYEMYPQIIMSTTPCHEDDLIQAMGDSLDAEPPVHGFYEWTFGYCENFKCKLIYCAESHGHGMYYIAPKRITLEDWQPFLDVESEDWDDDEEDFDSDQFSVASLEDLEQAEEATLTDNPWIDSDESFSTLNLEDTDAFCKAVGKFFS